MASNRTLRMPERVYILVSTCIYQYALPIVCSCGVGTSFLIIFILTRRDMVQRSINRQLLFLAITDLCFLLSALIYALARTFKARFPSVYVYCFTLILPYFLPATGRASLLLVFFVALARLVAVTRPVRCSLWCRHKRRFEALTTAISLLPLLYYVVRAVRYRVLPPDTNQTAWRHVMSEFSTRDVYYRAHTTVAEFVFRLMPITGILVINIYLYLHFKCHARGSYAVHLQMEPRQMKNYLLRQARLTCMLRLIFILTIVCLTPGAVGAQIGLFKKKNCKSSHSFERSISTLSLFLETINASSNFWVYTAMCGSFRRHVRRFLCCREGARANLSSNELATYRPSQGEVYCIASRGSTFQRRETRSLTRF